MSRPSPENHYEQLIVDNIRDHGWHCTSIGGEDDTPPFSYTIGLLDTFGHPELVIFGFNSTMAHSVLSIVARAAERGQAFDLGQSCDKLLDNYSCVFVEVPRAHHAEHVLSACWYYQDRDFPLYQIVWPSLDGHFPWHPDASEDLLAAQPVLGEYTGGT